MLVFATSAYYERFTPPRTTPAIATPERFPNGELHVMLQADPKGQDCVVIGTLAPPDEQLAALLVLADAIKQNGARKLIAFLPYLAYARQDKPQPRSGSGIALIGRLLKAAGIDEVVTIDVHSAVTGQLLGLPLRSISPASLFALELKKLAWSDVTVVAPDEGAKARAAALARELNHIAGQAYLVKKRVDGTTHVGLVGQVTPRAIVVDDVLDSGRTLISCCELLREKGVQEIAVAVTHGLFTDSDWQRLWDLGVQMLLVTDSHPAAARVRDPRLRVLTLTPATDSFRQGVR
jgi:ribose-phosphate pyrophosphokinase